MVRHGTVPSACCCRAVPRVFAGMQPSVGSKCCSPFSCKWCGPWLEHAQRTHRTLRVAGSSSPDLPCSPPPWHACCQTQAAECAHHTEMQPRRPARVMHALGLHALSMWVLRLCSALARLPRAARCRPASYAGAGRPASLTTRQTAALCPVTCIRAHAHLSGVHVLPCTASSQLP